MRCLGVSVIAVALACSVALAQPTSPEKQAEEYFNRGHTAYNLGRFDEAVQNFTKAYELWSQPAFLYNIAQAHRLAGHCKQALYFYKRFRSLKDTDTASPLSPQKREEIDRFISQLADCAAKADTSATAPPDTIDRPRKDTLQGTQGPAQAPDRSRPGDSGGTKDGSDVGERANPTKERMTVAERSVTSDDSTASPRSPSGSRMKVAGVATAGAGLGLAITGIVFGVMARSAQSDVEAAVKSGEPFDPDRDAAGRRDATISAVTLGVGAAAVVAGGVLFFLGSRDHAKPAPSDQARLRIIPSVGVATAGLTLDVRY